MNEKQDFYCTHLFYNKQIYPLGTEFIYNGIGKINNISVQLNNARCTFLYWVKNQYYFKHEDQIYMSDDVHFTWHIVRILPPSPKPQPKQEFIFTDEMFVNTLWYILIMVVGAIFHARWLIWICGTFIYYMTTFYKKK